MFSGAGAASISCAKLYKDLGVKAENILMTDTKGIMWKGRGEGFNKYKDEFVRETKCRTLADALMAIGLPALEGAKVTLEVDGPDEQEAMDALLALVADCFGEGE